MSWTTVTPEAGVESSSIPLEPAGAGLVTPPSPEAVARFQSAMSQPLAENARVGRLFAEVVSCTRAAILPAPVEAPASAEVKPAVAPVEVKPVVAPVATEVKPVVAPIEASAAAEVKPVVVPGEAPIEAPTVAEVKPAVVPIEAPTVAEVKPAVVPVEAPMAAEGKTPGVSVQADSMVARPAVPGGLGGEAVVAAIPVERKSEGVAQVDVPRVAVRPEAAGAEQAPTVAVTDTPEKSGAAVAVESRKADEAPDAERLVAAGVQVAPAARPVETPAPAAAADGIAPVAALSARDTAVRTDVLVEAATAVADTLLVSPSLLRGEGEILVQLKPEVLDGSQIHITVSGKALDVAFQTPTPELAEMLVARLPELQQHLAAAVPAYSFNVRVAGGRSKWTPSNS